MNLMNMRADHISLFVGNAEVSTAFYQALLDSPPTTQSAERTVFESDALPFVLTLETRRPIRSAPKDARRSPSRLPPWLGRRRQFVLVVPQPEQVGKAAVALRRAGARLRLHDAGIETHDPDGNAWRVRFVPSAEVRTIALLPAGSNETA